VSSLDKEAGPLQAPAHPTREPEDLETLENSGNSWFGPTVAGLRHDVWAGREERIRIIDESAEAAFDSLFG